MEKINIIGTGYVGLVMGAVLADLGHQVCCMDIDVQKIKNLQRGILPIFEKDLPELVSKNTQKTLFFTSQIKDTLLHSNLFFLALPTPQAADGKADLSFIFGFLNAFLMQADFQKEYIFVIKSTVTVGTCAQISAFLKAKNLKAHIISNPEFLREGLAVQDAFAPTRIVLGGENPAVLEKIKNIYAYFLNKNIPCYQTDWQTAELSKYAANGFLATKISFINALSQFSEKIGADIQTISAIMGDDPRIGKLFLQAGCGYGGSCLPKDVLALIQMTKQLPLTSSFFQQVEAINQKQKTHLVEKIRLHYPNKKAKIALWGLAFKANTDDIRESPALAMLDLLLADGFEVCVYDPKAMEQVRAIYGEKIRYGLDPYGALEGANALLIANDWAIFKNADLQKTATLLKDKLIFDGRNLFSKKTAQKYGLDHIGIG